MLLSWKFQAEYEEKWIYFLPGLLIILYTVLLQFWQCKLEETLSHISSFTYEISHWDSTQCAILWLSGSLRSKFNFIWFHQWFHQFTGKANDTSYIQKKNELQNKSSGKF